MKPFHRMISLALVLLPSLAAAVDAEWAYSGPNGPEHWSTVNAQYAACNGKNQSPINIVGAIEAELAPLVVSYQPGSRDIVNNGHTVQVNFNAGSSIVVDGTRFELRQFHAHAPSENLIDGKSFPLELHLVHADADGNLAVVGVMLIEGAENPALAAAWGRMPHDIGKPETPASPVSAAGLLPASLDYYRFSGSLTTPPCTEGVRWLVMKSPIAASKRQIEGFTHAVHHANNRPSQLLNAREILK